MRKKISQISFVLVLLVIIAVVIYGLSGKSIVQVKTDKSAEVAVLQEKLVDLSELAVLKYEYSNVIISRLEHSLSLPVLPDIKYAETIKLIQYSGYLKAGTDFSKVQFTYDGPSKKVLVKVSKSQILDNVVETEKTTVEDVKGNLLSDYPTQTIFDEINTQKIKLEKDKIAQGFLKDADERVRQLIISFLKTNGYEDVSIEFL